MTHEELLPSLSSQDPRGGGQLPLRLHGVASPCFQRAVRLETDVYPEDTFVPGVDDVVAASAAAVAVRSSSNQQELQQVLRRRRASRTGSRDRDDRDDNEDDEDGDDDPESLRLRRQQRREDLGCLRICMSYQREEECGIKVIVFNLFALVAYHLAERFIVPCVARTYVGRMRADHQGPGL